MGGLICQFLRHSNHPLMTGCATAKSSKLGTAPLEVTTVFRDLTEETGNRCLLIGVAAHELAHDTLGHVQAARSANGCERRGQRRRRLHSVRRPRRAAGGDVTDVCGPDIEMDRQVAIARTRIFLANERGLAKESREDEAARD